MKNESLEGRTKRLSQLTPFKKGMISNPAGRGIGKDLWNWAAKLGPPADLIEPMRKIFHIPYGKLNVEAAIILRLTLEALKGDLRAIELWLDRKYGKVTTPIEMEMTNNGPLVQILNAPAGDKSMTVVRDVQANKIIDMPVEQLPDNPEHGCYPVKDE